ncbi:hypothetical protein KY290_000478 [Solanum tuberosum]|uniref:Kinesin motor domain-containing protein n=1 Tax=Solanum tuberosum TaxID=4113 RepID=A0ABQ7WJF6_SOLTU|nr:hypothetical protein KY290_000478 [Solanum tuberosum]
MDKSYNLLELKQKEIFILDDKDGQIHLKGLAQVAVSSTSEFQQAFSCAVQKRKVAHTGTNDVSSRSHVLVTLYVSTPTCHDTRNVITAKLNLIDLAGNQDNRRTCNTGIRLQESTKINQSLFALSNVINALNNNQPRIPYTESKLTRLLQDSVGGTSRALMVACLIPAEYQESLHTFSLASRSTHISNFLASAQKGNTPKVKTDMEAKLRPWLESKGKTKSTHTIGAFDLPFTSKTPNSICSTRKLGFFGNSSKQKFISNQGASNITKRDPHGDCRNLFKNGHRANLVAEVQDLADTCEQKEKKKFEVLAERVVPDSNTADFLTHTSPAGEIKNKLLTDKHTAIWFAIFPTTMVLRLNIDQIEPATRDWICKVQIVEIGRPRESLDKKCTFQNLILEDEQECQIRGVMYSDEIEQYATTLKLFNTYLISTARVKVSPTSYGKPIHQFYWILDKETVIEQIKPSNEVEKPLPPPTKLNITSFDRIPHLVVDSAAEIDVLAVVLCCGPQKTAGRSHHRQNQFLFTLWEDFGEIEGHQISSKMAIETDLLVILGRSIGISTYKGLLLQTRYNSTVRVNPNYPQAVAILNWAKQNKTLLLTSPSNTTSTSSSVAPMIATPSGQQLISIAEISSAPSMGVFYVQAEMAILDEFQDFCVVECSGCKQKKRTKDRKDFDCPKCNRKTSLVPRWSFQIDLIDNTATTTASISAELGEKLLSMTAEDIFDITCTKRQSLSLNHVHEMLSSKVFEIQLRKSSWSSSNTTTTTLSILSYMEKHHTTQSATDRTSKKIKPLEIGEVEVMATTAAAGPSNAVEKVEPPTPTKKV